MFFILSKILSFFIVPINFLFVITLLWWFSAAVLKRVALTKFLARFTILAWFIVGYYPVPDYLLSQLENTYPQANVGGGLILRMGTICGVTTFTKPLEPWSIA